MCDDYHNEDWKTTVPSGARLTICQCTTGVCLVCDQDVNSPEVQKEKCHARFNVAYHTQLLNHVRCPNVNEEVVTPQVYDTHVGQLQRSTR